MSNDVISEMLYGDRMIFAPDCDVAAGAVIKIKDKAGVGLEDIAAGHAGEFENQSRCSAQFPWLIPAWRVRG